MGCYAVLEVTNLPCPEWEHHQKDGGNKNMMVLGISHNSRTLRAAKFSKAQLWLPPPLDVVRNICRA